MAQLCPPPALTARNLALALTPEAACRVGLPVAVSSPAGDRAVRLDAAAVAAFEIAPGADGDKSGVGVDALRAAHRVGLIIAVMPPAGDRVVRLDAAGVEGAGADGDKSGVGVNAGGVCRAGLSVAVKAPTDHCAVRLDAAAVEVTGADGEESSVGVGAGGTRRVGLAVAVKAPAGDRVVRLDAAAVKVAGADAEESGVGVNAMRAGCRAGLSVAVKAPTGDRVVRLNAAGVEVAGADGDKPGVGVDLRPLAGSVRPLAPKPQQTAVLSALTPQVWDSPALIWAWALRCRQTSIKLMLRLSVSSRSGRAFNASLTGKGDRSAVMMPVLTMRRGSSEETMKLLLPRSSGVMLTSIVRSGSSSVNSARMAA